MRRSRFEPLYDLSPVEILGFFLVAMGVLCLLALTCAGCVGAPFEAGLEVPDASPPAVFPPVGSLGPNPSHPAEDSGGEQWVSEGKAPGAEVDAVVPLEAAQAPDGGVASDASGDRPMKELAPDAAPEAGPEAGPPPPDPACLRCSITCSASALSYPCAGAGASAPVSCGHASYVAGDLACAAPGACVVGGPCGLPENPACWGGVVEYVRGASCP